jgi:hypothetical protein
MHEAIPPLPNTPSWPGAQLNKAQGQFYLYLYLYLPLLKIRDRFEAEANRVSERFIPALALNCLVSLICRNFKF